MTEERRFEKFGILPVVLTCEACCTIQQNGSEPKDQSDAMGKSSIALLAP
jgi:hypothetical protein